MKKKKKLFFSCMLAAFAVVVVSVVVTLYMTVNWDSADFIAVLLILWSLSLLIPTVLFFALVYLLHRGKKYRIKLQALRQELTALYNTLPGGILRCKNDETWTVLFASRGFYRFLGYDQRTFAKKFNNQAIAVLHPDDWKKLRQNFTLLLTQKTVITDEYRLICADSSVKWIWMNTELFKDESGENHFYCTFTDITPIKETQEQLLVNERLYEIVLEQTQDTIFECNLRDNTAYFSKNFLKKFGYLPCTENFLECLVQSGNIHPGDMESFHSLCRQINGKKSSKAEFRVRKADGSYLWCSVTATAILDKKGEVLKAVGILSDIDAQRQMLQSVKEFAQKDSLTGLYNKGATETHIRSYLDQNSAPAALIIIDIDNFKQVNDTLGHLYGDAALKEIANAIKSLFRSTDIVGRIGGDEFVIFLEQVSDRKMVLHKAGLITEIFQNTFAQTNVNYQMTGSIGIALYPNDANHYTDLFDKADIALYYAKNHGKNQFAFYNEKVEEENVLRCGLGVHEQ